jgi:uncharacterized membrane protein
MAHRGGHPWIGPLILLVLFGALLFAAFVFWRTLEARTVTTTVAPPASDGARDPALAELRLRYARGEIDRNEYLVRATDLGEVVPASPLPAAVTTPPATVITPPA